MTSWVVAVLLGVVQGVLEWLPVSSEGSVALVLTALGEAPDVATQFALFLHLGTAAAALAYYDEEVLALVEVGRARALASEVGRTSEAAGEDTLSFLVVATLASFLTGGAAYATIEQAATALSGGAFVALIGVLLIGTGLLQYVADERGPDRRQRPNRVDALLVGGLQGLAILPGVSRSGTTVSALLLRGHGGERSLELSFLLSIPAALAAGALVFVDVGVPSVSPALAILAVVVSGVVGYLTVGLLVGLVRRVAFWGVCVGFGGLAVLGGALLVL